MSFRQLLFRLFSGPAWICPFCGSDDLKTTSAKSKISVSGDRLCKACGASWAPPVPKSVAATMLVLLLLLSALVGKLSYDSIRHDVESKAATAKMVQSVNQLSSGPFGSATPASSAAAVQAREPAPSATSLPPLPNCIALVAFLVPAWACLQVLRGKYGAFTVHARGSK